MLTLNETTSKKLSTIYESAKSQNTSDHIFYIPISGGTDSALTFYIYTQLFPTRTIGVHFGEELPFENWFSDQGKIIKELRWDTYDKEIARWAKLLEMSIRDNAIIVGTRNKTEHELGTFSHASRISYQLPIVSLYKSEVLEICEFVGCPKEMIDGSRAPDPNCGRYEDYTKIGLEKIDQYLNLLLQNKTIENAENEGEQKDFEFVKRLYEKNMYKKNLPLIL